MEKYEEIDFKKIFSIMLTNKILIILILLLSIVLGYFYSYYYKRPEYKSTVTMLLSVNEEKNSKELTQTDLTLNSSLISTYTSIIKSTSVIAKTIENLGLNISVENLQKDIEVIQVKNTQFLKVSVKNNKPEVSKNIANELVKVFAEQIKEIYKIQNINIIDEAEIENKPCNVNHIKDICISGTLGVFVSILLIMFIYLFDDTIKDEKDLEAQLKLMNIGVLPLDNENKKLITESSPKSNVVEAIKTIRTNILYSTRKKTILLTSCNSSEGKSWITDNLSVAFSKAGKKVILVDTNLRKESNKSEIFEIEKGEGLSDFIKEITDNDEENLEKARKYIKETNIPNLHVLQKGTIPPNPSELISSNNMKKLLNLLKNMYDLILLDGTPCMLISDSLALSAMSDSTIIVVENKKTKMKDLKKVKKLIEEVNGKILGTIINKSEVKKGKYYGKKYGYYYGKDNNEVEKVEKRQKIISLEKIIEMARQNINEKQEINEEPNENKEKIENNQVETEENKEYYVKLQKLENKCEENFEVIMKKIMKEVNQLNDEIENLRKIQCVENTNILNKIGNISYEEEIAKLNEKIENINYEEELVKLNEKIENINYEEELVKLNEKIESMNYKEEIEDASQEKDEMKKILKNEEKKANNIISFEAFKHKRKKNKKVFPINETISYDDLQRLSTYVIDLNEDIPLNIALSE